MKKKSIFSQIILFVVILILCIFLTVSISLFAGSYTTTLFNFENLNVANMVPVLIIGGVITCLVVGIAVLFIGKNVLSRIIDYFNEDNGGGN